MKLSIEFEEDYKELINHLTNSDEVWIPYSYFDISDFYLFDNKKIHLNFNIKNLYFVWYYVKNNLELLEKTYNSFVNEDYKIINNLSIKSDKPIVRASATLVNINNKLSEKEFQFLSTLKMNNIELYHNADIPKEAIMFQDLSHLNDSEVFDLLKYKNKKVITTTNDKHLVNFDGYNAVKIVDNYIIWN